MCKTVCTRVCLQRIEDTFEPRYYLKSMPTPNWTQAKGKQRFEWPHTTDNADITNQFNKVAKHSRDDGESFYPISIS